MRTLTRAGLTTATLIGIVAGPALTLTAPATAAPQTVKERGVVLDCSGTYRGREVHTEVYENGTYGNSVSVSIGERDRGGVHGSRATTDSLWAKKTVKATVKVDGKRATITGLAQRVGPKKAVHDEFDDGDEHIVADGFHRRLKNDLTLKYRGTRVDLTCDSAFFYNLTVTKETIA